MMNKSQLHEKTNIILEYPYKTAGWLKITASQLIFNKIGLSANTFSGIINVKDIEQVNYLKEIFMIRTPGVEIVYRLPGEKYTKKVTIHFPGSATRLGIKQRSGITPEKVFETITSLQRK
ncbi:MAG: hypothetical protein DCC56_08730 [Anaerolineae bacterium]|nr:MAG: hypothetical protein DCC56_08730 [Anaerolineae bacterium]WKZ45325.1 MAG: hypothetical protein QY302_06000 [Anaerolineales bacterium]